MPDNESRSMIDSNIWLYASIEGGDARKSARARAIVEAADAALSTQVINEGGDYAHLEDH
jgi:predicted nucleic acid-binding protein